MGHKTEKETVSSFDKLKYLNRKQKKNDELQQNYPSSNASSNSLRENRLKKVQKGN